MQTVESKVAEKVILEISKKMLTWTDDAGIQTDLRKRLRVGKVVFFIFSFCIHVLVGAHWLLRTQSSSVLLLSFEAFGKKIHEEGFNKINS